MPMQELSYSTGKKKTGRNYCTTTYDFHPHSHSPPQNWKNLALASRTLKTEIKTKTYSFPPGKCIFQSQYNFLKYNPGKLIFCWKKKNPKAPVLFFDRFWKTIVVVIYNAKVIINCWLSKCSYSALLGDWETKIYFQIELESDSFIQLNYNLLEISFLLFQLHVMKEKKSIPFKPVYRHARNRRETRWECSQNRNKIAPKVSLSVPSDIYTRSLRIFSKQSREVNVGFLASSCSKPHLQWYT